MESFGGPNEWFGMNWESITSVIKHAFLPALSMILASSGLYALTMRGMMVTVMGEDYITLAKAKGLRGHRIFLWYALRSTMLPQATSFALSIGHIVTGSILVEMIFAYPGVGSLLFESVKTTREEGSFLIAFSNGSGSLP